MKKIRKNVTNMNLIIGDCRKKLKEISDCSIDIVYLDPPFFTQKMHSLKNKDNSIEYKFDDNWESLEEYLNFINSTLIECKRVLKETGSIFLHCDKSASHYLRVLLDKVFGMNNFQSEIIWSYKRWSNSKKGLLNNHQNIYFYSKSMNFKFNTIYTDYSPTTNIDQILQERQRNSNGKSEYKKDINGNIIFGKEKMGVPLSDIWEIPFLNPKAKERSGYPTQKPVLLLEQIIKMASDENDLILDPFCGSGTTLLAAQNLNRKFIGIDISIDAIRLTQKRLEELIITKSNLLKNGKENYIQKTERELNILKNLDAIPVQRNNGIDGFLKKYYNGKPVTVKIQKDCESLQEAKKRLLNASKTKNCEFMILIKTNNFEENLLFMQNLSMESILVISSYDLIINDWIKENNTIQPSEYIGIYNLV